MAVTRLDPVGGDHGDCEIVVEIGRTAIKTLWRGAGRISELALPAAARPGGAWAAGAGGLLTLSVGVEDPGFLAGPAAGELTV